ncbi:MAG: MATE family efflux transporter, partial [Oscillospiraceae bacterium]|nr:MATE family efflux transporter [Oscillospiraceae bacterium]
YNLSDETTALAMNLLAVMSLVMLGMAYQYPVHSGIIQGGGDAKFVMNMNLISIWVIVMPLSFLSAFVWHWPVEAVVLVIQSDQIFKSLPTFIRFRSYKWIKTLTR